MALITKISGRKRRAKRRNIYIDGRFVFGCHENVVARFRLREGMQIGPEQIGQIKEREIFQECFDKATAFLSRRLHSSAELKRKLLAARFSEDVVSSVIQELSRLGYVDDDRFAKTKALAAAQHRQHGRRRALLELLKAGVSPAVAERAVAEVYDEADDTEVARRLARKHAARLRDIDSMAARRRLAGMLQRRGFEYESIKPVIDEVLGSEGSAE